jgi:hypothetical protein
MRVGAEPIGIEHCAPAAVARAFDLGASSCLAGSAIHAAHSQHNTHCVVIGAREHKRSQGICVLVYALGWHAGLRYSTGHAAGMPVCLSSLGIDVYGNTYVHECMRAPTHALCACSSSVQARRSRNKLSTPRAKETPRLAPVPRVQSKVGLQSYVYIHP